MSFAIATDLGLGPWSVLLPCGSLAFFGLVALLADFGPLSRSPVDRRRRVAGGLGIAGCLVALAWLLWPAASGSSSVTDPDPVLFGGALADDLHTKLFSALIAVALALILGQSIGRGDFSPRRGFYGFLLASGAGALASLVVEDLDYIFVALSVAFGFAMAAAATASEVRFDRIALLAAVLPLIFLRAGTLLVGGDDQSQFAAVRESFLRQADANAPGGGAGLTSGVLIGVCLAGAGLSLLVVGLPRIRPTTLDVDEGPEINAWLTTGPKVAATIVTLKAAAFVFGPTALLLGADATWAWAGLVGTLAAIGMAVGSVMALRSRRSNGRSLAWAASVHGGLLLVGVLAASLATRQLAYLPVGAVLFYLVAYVAATVAAFAGVGQGTSRIRSRSMPLAVGVTVALISLAGLPPLAGFWSRLDVLAAAHDAYHPIRPILFGLIGLAIIASLALLVRYLGIVRVIFNRGETSFQPIERVSRGVAWSIGVGGLVSVGLGVYPAFPREMLGNAAQALMSINRALGERYKTELDPTPIDPKTDPEMLLHEKYKDRLRSAAPGA